MGTFRHSSVVGGSLAIAIAGFTVATVWFAGRWQHDPLPPPPDKTQPPVRARQARPIYKYSVVRGGVYSRGEVVESIRTDAAVAAHYRGIDPGRLVVQTAGTARARHVSFRIGNAVFWTRRPVKIPSGEAILASPGTEIRARCGNRMSETAQQPTLPPDVPEPTEDELTSVTGSTEPDAPDAPAENPRRVQTAPPRQDGSVPPGLSLAPPERLQAPWWSRGPSVWYVAGGPGLYPESRPDRPGGVGPVPIPPAELLTRPTQVPISPSEVATIVWPNLTSPLISAPATPPVPPLHPAETDIAEVPRPRGGTPNPTGETGSTPAVPPAGPEAPPEFPVVLYGDPPSVPFEPPGGDDPDPPRTAVPEPGTALVVVIAGVLLASLRSGKTRLSRR